MLNNDGEKVKSNEKQTEELYNKLVSHYGSISIDLLKKRMDILTDNIQEFVEAEEEWNKK